MPQSNPQEDEFHKCVGYSITAWAKVEEWLFELCWRSLASSKECAAIVYFRTPTLDARIQLVDELVRTILPKPERKSGGHAHPDVVAWSSLKQKISSHLSTRRRIAHHPVRPQKTTVVLDGTFGGAPFGSVPFGSGAVREEVSWLEIFASENEQLRGRGEEVQPLKATDIMSYSYLVNGLADEVMNYYLNVFLKHVKPS